MAQVAKGIYTKALSADHWRTAIAQSAEGAALTGLGRYREADNDLSHSLQILSKNSGAPPCFAHHTAILGFSAPRRAWRQCCICNPCGRRRNPRAVALMT